ncbi:hypothetical protein M378DRAFT_333223 [Amanita muscaria Koide BX008]|uniref:Uncharacterized protein n=1 Tax=Amanita muscaria (strain Koide BX008) TaxID=946122 RepID=A0A0C2S6F3_AMAMK|nr:hypothetical protein M378DRAFT_333223 [Amanita muscaria Koide BX008]
MTVSIVQVMNNTSRTLHYHNLKNGKKIDIGPKTQQFENNAWIPSSNFYDDEVPSYSSGHSINVWLENGPTLEITDDKWRFRIVGPVAYTNERAEDWYGTLTSGGQYILRVDEVDDGRSKNCGLSFLTYEDKYRVTAGYIASQLIQHAAPITGMVLMAIFL